MCLVPTFSKTIYKSNTRGVSHKSKHDNQTSGEKLHDGLTGCLVVIYYYWASRDENGSEGGEGVKKKGARVDDVDLGYFSVVPIEM